VAAVHEVLAQANFEADVANLSDAMAVSYGIIINARSFPVLDVTINHTRSLRLRMVADNWDDLPPSIELLNPDGSSLSSPVPGGVFNPSVHPNTGRPFVCMRGSREFHTYPTHRHEAWAQYRGQDGMGLVGILLQLATAWRKAVR
jgi:hypothetical protein